MQTLDQKIDQLIFNNYSSYQSTNINIYKLLILNFIKNNGNYILLNDDNNLSFFINTYYKILTNDQNITLEEYLKLNSLLINNNNIVSSIIKDKYNSLKNELLTYIISNHSNNNDINQLIDKTINNYKDKTYEKTLIELCNSKLSTLPLEKRFTIYYSNQSSANMVQKMLCEYFEIDNIEKIKDSLSYTDEQIKEYKVSNIVNQLIKIENNTNLNLNPYINIEPTKQR